MLFWLFIACCFFVYVLARYLFDFIKWIDAVGLFILATLIFTGQISYIHYKATSDEMMVTGYVTSLLYHPAYVYDHGRHKDHEPERWMLEVRPHLPLRNVNVHYSIMGGAGKEYCQGECFFGYPTQQYHDYDPNKHEQSFWILADTKPPLINFDTSIKNDSAMVHVIDVDSIKFNKTHLGEASTFWKVYFNPVKASSEVIYTDAPTIPYFTIQDYNRADRIVAPLVTAADQIQLNNINAKLAALNIQIGLIITSDNLLFEKIKHSWYQGKANDFIVVICTKDDNRIVNVDVLAWDNYALKEKVAEAVMATHWANIPLLLTTIEKNIIAANNFSIANFSKYQFLDVKIPESDYFRILFFQIFFLIYMIWLLRFKSRNPGINLGLQMWLFLFVPISILLIIMT